VIGGFFFLRFVGPAITTPHVYGLVKDPPNENAQRYEVLLSKVLQSISNETLPGQKEGYMESMNEFIQTHVEESKKFLKEISDPSSPEAKSSVSGTYEVPTNVKTNGLLLLQTHLSKFIAKITAELETYTPSADLQSLRRKVGECIDHDVVTVRMNTDNTNDNTNNNNVPATDDDEYTEEQ